MSAEVLKNPEAQANALQAAANKTALNALKDMVGATEVAYDNTSSASYSGCSCGGCGGCGGCGEPCSSLLPNVNVVEPDTSTPSQSLSQ